MNEAKAEREVDDSLSASGASVVSGQEADGYYTVRLPLPPRPREALEVADEYEMDLYERVSASDGRVSPGTYYELQDLLEEDRRVAMEDRDDKRQRRAFYGLGDEQ